MVIEPVVHTLEIPTRDAHPVRADLYLPATSDPAGIVLLCHGFKGHKSWGFLPHLAEKLRDAGLVAMSVDMSFNGTFALGNGQSPTGDPDGAYPRPDLFERNTLERECEDLTCVIHFVSEGGLREQVARPLPLGLFGHSRGGVIAVLNAIEQPSVKALCTWSTTDDPDFFTAEQKDKWRREGKYYFVDSAHNTKLAVGVDYLDDLERNHERYALAERVKELRVPHLIVHGKVDLVVPVDCAMALHEAEAQLEHRRLVVLQTGHTFGIPYPSPPEPARPSAALEEACGETVSWFTTFLDRGGSK